MKLVSIVVATYKREAELKRALASLATQTYPNIEIVLVDDNADAAWNEAVSAVAEEFRGQFPQIPLQYIVNTCNRGSAETRNIGIEAAAGEYVTFLDDDDVYLPSKVEKQLSLMESGGYDYSITDLELYNENGKLCGRVNRLAYIREGMTAEELLCAHLKYHLTGTDTMMFTKAYLLKIGGFSPINVGDEFYLMQKAIEGGGTFAYLPGSEVHAYVHTGECAGVSSGDGKIRGEKEIYRYKKTLFHKIDRKSRRYICTRHYAVLAYAQWRRRRFFAFAYNATRAILVSPIGCFKIIKERRR